MFKTCGFQVQQPGVPIASNVTFSGTLSIGSTLTQSHTFTDPKGLSESGTTYRWQRANDGSGTGAADIISATNDTYVVQSADMDKYIRVGVTPRNSNDIAGVEVFSAWQQAWITNPLWTSTVLLAHLDGSNGATGPFTDSGPNGHTIARASTNGQLSTSIKKFGTAAYRGGTSSGVGDGLNCTGTLTDFTFGTGDFTIAGWFYFGESVSTTQTIFDWRGTGGPTLYISGANIKFDPTAANAISAAHGMSISTWNFIELTRISGVTKLFVNGVQKGSNYTDSNNYGIGTVFRVGTGPAGTMLQGGIDDVFVLKGAGWHSSNYTAPSAPWEQYQAP